MAEINEPESNDAADAEHADDAPSAAVQAKRGRGRPPKAKGEGAAAPKVKPVLDPTAPKRGRGRPPRNATTTNGPLEAAGNDAAPVEDEKPSTPAAEMKAEAEETSPKGRRGRKPAAEVVKEEEEKPVGRRGRKPKAEAAEASIEDTVAEAPTEPKGRRGRKPKAAAQNPIDVPDVPLESDVLPPLDDAASPEAPTGRRGRKPKAAAAEVAPPEATGRRGRPRAVVEAEPVAAEAPEGETPTKGKRGRKAAGETEVVDTDAPPKKRGRPPRGSKAADEGEQAPAFESEPPAAVEAEEHPHAPVEGEKKRRGRPPRGAVGESSIPKKKAPAAATFNAADYVEDIGELYDDSDYRSDDGEGEGGKDSDWEPPSGGTGKRGVATDDDGDWRASGRKKTTKRAPSGGKRRGRPAMKPRSEGVVMEAAEGEQEAVAPEAPSTGRPRRGRAAVVEPMEEPKKRRGRPARTEEAPVEAPPTEGEMPPPPVEAAEREVEPAPKPDMDGAGSDAGSGSVTADAIASNAAGVLKEPKGKRKPARPLKKAIPNGVEPMQIVARPEFVVSTRQEMEVVVRQEMDVVVRPEMAVSTVGSDAASTNGCATEVAMDACQQPSGGEQLASAIKASMLDEAMAANEVDDIHHGAAVLLEVASTASMSPSI